jgi:hypothetical protein
MRATIICGTLMALIIPAATGAEDQNSANYLLPGCKAFLTAAPDPVFVQGLCVGTVTAIAFMAGVSDLAVNPFSGPGQLQAVEKNWRCADIPREVTYGEIIQVAVRYIEARPNRMHEPFRSLALEAILDAWPCRS